MDVGRWALDVEIQPVTFQNVLKNEVGTDCISAIRG